MTRLDAALLDLTVSVRRILLHRPTAQQQAVRHALADIAVAARAEVEGVDPREQLRVALERTAQAFGWSEVMIIVNKQGRRHAGPARRAG